MTVTFLHPATGRARPLIGVSACLCGEPVRYDGSAKYLPGISDWLEQTFCIETLCPEQGAGLGVPRPPVNLVVVDGQHRARGRDNPDLDVTEKLQRFGRHYIERLPATLCGLVLKSRSPSCAVGTAPIRDGAQRTAGDGLFAAHLRQQAPWLPVVDDTALSEPAARRRFEWQCRFLYDVRVIQPNIPLAHCAAHYRPYWQQVDAEQRRRIEHTVQRAAREDWIAAVRELLAARPQLPGAAPENKP